MFDKLTLMVFIAAAAQLQHCSSIAVKMAKIWKYEKKNLFDMEKSCHEAVFFKLTDISGAPGMNPAP